MALRPERLSGSQASDAPDHSRRRAAPLTQGRTGSAWAALGLLLAISIFSYADRYLMSALTADIKAQFGLSDGFVGLLMGPAFAVMFSLLAIPIAGLADRSSRIAIVCAGCLVWSAFTLLSGLAQSAPVLVAARIGVGVGEAAFQAPAYSLLSARFAPERRGGAFGVLALAVYLGQVLAYVAGPQIAVHGGWRTPFLALGAAGAGLAIVAYAVVREPARPAVADSGKRRPPVEAAGRAIRSASYNAMTLGMTLGVFSGLSFGLWGPALFARAYGLDARAAGAVFGSAFTVPGMVGAVASGLLIDRLARRGAGRAVLVAAASLLAATLSILAAAWAPDTGSAMACAVLAGVLGGGWSVGVMAGFQYVLPERARATGTALALLVVALGGTALGPWLTGVLSDAFGGGAGGLRLALTLVIPTGALGALAPWRAAGALDPTG